MSKLKAEASDNRTLARVVFNHLFWAQRVVYHRDLKGVHCQCQECSELQGLIADMPYAMKYKLALALFRWPDILKKLSTNVYGEDIDSSVVMYRREVIEKTMMYHKIICPDFRKKSTRNCILCEYWCSLKYRIRVWRAGLISWTELV